MAQEVSTGVPPAHERNRERKLGIVKKKPTAEKKMKPASAPEPDSSVAVNCSHVSIEKTDSLKPNPRNPNTHPEEQIKLLANIIAKTGWRSPIVVSKRSGFVTKGHGRLMAAKLLGLKTVPVDFQDYPDDAAELADMVADNRIAELAEFDRAVLKDILQELDTGAFDMLQTGFDLPALEAMMTAIHPDDIDHLFQKGDTPRQDENTITLHYTPEDYERVMAAFKEREGTKEAVVMELLGL